MDVTIAKTKDPALIHALTQAAFAEYGREPGTSTALKETEEAIAAQLAEGMAALVVSACPHPPAPSPHVLSSLQASWGEGESEELSPSPLSRWGSEERGDFGRGARGEGPKGEGIACVRYQIEGDALYFHRLSVHPDYRRQGLAKKLVGHLEALARAQGLARLTCSVRLQKTDNVALYTGLGFQLLGERSVCRDGTAVPTGDFEKLLLKMTVQEARDRYNNLPLYKPFLDIPQLSRNDIKEVWGIVDHEGPVSGILQWQGSQYMYEFLDQGNVFRGSYLRMLIVKLSDEELDYDMYWGKKFAELLQNGDGQQQYSFYNDPKALEYLDRDYSNHIAIAWFDFYEKVGERA